MRYILPGMGASSRMYVGPWFLIRDSCFIDWPKYNQESSITELAQRLIKEYSICQRDIIIGSSLGGMVALEIAQMVGAYEVYLIGSAINPNELSLLAKVSMPFAGSAVVKISQRVSSWVNNRVMRMYAESDPDFIVSMSKAIRSWQGFKGDPKIVKRIHGRKDRLITCPENCERIDNGGHLIAITHAPECVDFIYGDSGLFKW